MELPGENNLVVFGFGHLVERSWADIGATPYAMDEVTPYPAEAALPRAALFVVGDREHWYVSAESQAAQVAWLAATEPDRETALCLLYDGMSRQDTTIPTAYDSTDLPVAAIDGIGEVRTTTYGTHGAVTRLETWRATREPRPGTVWLPRWTWDPHPLSDTQVSGVVPYLSHHKLFENSSLPVGIGPGQRWLCPQVPGTLLWWRLMALSLTTPGHDIVFGNPIEDVDLVRRLQGVRRTAAARPTAMAATAEQWTWVAERWGDGVGELELQHVVIVERESSAATEQWLGHAFPRARVSYGFV